MSASSYVRSADLQVKLVQKGGGCPRIVICTHKDAELLGERSVTTIRDALVARIEDIDFGSISIRRIRTNHVLALMVISLPMNTDADKAVRYSHLVRRVLNDYPKLVVAKNRSNQKNKPKYRNSRVAIAATRGV